MSALSTRSCCWTPCPAMLAMLLCNTLVWLRWRLPLIKWCLGTEPTPLLLLLSLPSPWTLRCLRPAAMSLRSCQPCLGDRLLALFPSVRTRCAKFMQDMERRLISVRPQPLARCSMSSVPGRHLRLQQLRETATPGASSCSRHSDSLHTLIFHHHHPRGRPLCLL